MTPAPTTREAELARRREYEARREAEAVQVFYDESGAFVVGGAVTAAELDAKYRLMLTEGWF